MTITLDGTTGITTPGLTGLTTPVPVASGGTGAATATAYAVQCGGTTTTGAHQSIASVGTTGQVLTSNGAAALPTFQTVSSSPIPTIDAKTSGTSATWTIPTSVTKVRITVVGGGGNGGNNGTDYGGGGGGGGYAVKVLTVVAGTLTYTVGAATGTSQVSSGTNNTITTIQATGGSSGGATAGGAGGAGSNGDINISGATGGSGVVEAASYVINGIGGNSMLGFGGASNLSATGLVGNSYGGGASGSRNASKAGAGGIVIFEY
jgi:hypothetical protein